MPMLTRTAVVLSALMLALAAGIVIGAISAQPTEIVCDNVEFHDFDVPYAVQGTCAINGIGGAPVLVTLLD